MQVNVIERNERLMILADHRAQLSSPVIRKIAHQISRRGLVLVATPDIAELDWEDLYEQAGQCLRTIPGFNDEEEQRIATTIREILQFSLPPHVHRVLAEYAKAGAPRGSSRLSPAAAMYHQFSRHSRDPLIRDASAILSAELAKQGLVISKTRIVMKEFTKELCRSLYERIADNDVSRSLWESLDDAEKAAAAASIEPILQPFSMFLLRSLSEARLINPSPAVN